MVDIMTKPFMKYANETHTGVFEVPPSQQNEILDTGVIKNSTAVRKRIADKNKLGEQFGLKTSVFINPQKVADEKYGLGIDAKKNKEAVYKWRQTAEGHDKYNDYQMELYKKLSANDEWRKAYNERAKIANKKWRDSKAGEREKISEAKRKEREAIRLAKQQAKEANKKPIGRPAKKKITQGDYNPTTGLYPTSVYASRNRYKLKTPRPQKGKGIFDEGIEFCDKPYYNADIFV